MLKISKLEFNQVVNLEGKDNYFVSVEKIEVLDNKGVAIGFSGADTAKVYFMDYIEAFPQDFNKEVKEIFGIEVAL